MNNFWKCLKMLLLWLIVRKVKECLVLFWNPFKWKCLLLWGIIREIVRLCKMGSMDLYIRMARILYRFSKNCLITTNILNKPSVRLPTKYSTKNSTMKNALMISDYWSKSNKSIILNHAIKCWMNQCEKLKKSKMSVLIKSSQSKSLNRSHSIINVDLMSVINLIKYSSNVDLISVIHIMKNLWKPRKPTWNSSIESSSSLVIFLVQYFVKFLQAIALSSLNLIKSNIIPKVPWLVEC